MASNTVLKEDAIEASIARDLFRDGLRTAAAAGGDPFTDPLAADRAAATDAANFVMTSYPSRNPFYPHVIVEEGGDVAERLDQRVDLLEHDYQVQFSIVAKSRTHAKTIKGGVKNWVLANRSTIQDAGLHDIQLLSSTSVNWDTGSSVFEYRLVYSGVLYGEPNT